MSYFVYLLKCNDSTLYCGYTNDLDMRIKKHASGEGAKYTRSRLPVELVYYESIQNLSDALKREYAIKALSRKEKDKLIWTYQSINKKH